MPRGLVTSPTHPPPAALSQAQSSTVGSGSEETRGNVQRACGEAARFNKADSNDGKRQARIRKQWKTESQNGTWQEGPLTRCCCLESFTKFTSQPPSTPYPQPCCFTKKNLICPILFLEVTVEFSDIVSVGSCQVFNRPQCEEVFPL